MTTPNRFCVGLDLGKQTDPSALALLQWHCPPPRRPVAFAPPPPPPPRPVYEVPTLKRWPLGTAYRKIAGDVARFLKAPPFSDLSEAALHPVLVVDVTGVGDAVYEMIWEQLVAEGVRGRILAVAITAGRAVTLAEGKPGRWHVAKKQLASVLQRLLGERRLLVAQGQPEAKTLAAELGTFSVKITEALNETFESWREQDHDDLVLAVALAAWAAETLDVLFKPASRPPLPDRLVLG